jgi:hypothetical protein
MLWRIKKRPAASTISIRWADAVIGFRLAWNIGDAGWQKSPAYQLYTEFGREFCWLFLLILYVLSRFSKKLSLYGAQSRNLLFRLNTTLLHNLSLSLSTLVTLELQIFVFAIKFKYFKNSLFYYLLLPYPTFSTWRSIYVFFLITSLSAVAYSCSAFITNY